MKIGVQLLDDHYLPYPSDDFKMIAEAGFNSVALDLSLFFLSQRLLNDFEFKEGQALSPRQKLTHTLTGNTEEIKKHFYTYKAAATKNGLVFAHINAPSISQIAETYSIGNEEREKYYEIIKNCILLCEWMDCSNLIIHPFAASRLSSNQEFEENRDLLLSIASIARKHHVILCFENEYRINNGRYLRGVCSDPYTAADYVDRLNHLVGEERFGLCLNTGNCNLFGQNIYDVIIELSRRIRTVRIQDNDGIWDQRSMPYVCTRDGRNSATDWRGFVRGMREISYQGDLSFVADGSVNSFPSNMRASVLRLIAETGRFMAEQIEIENILGQYGQIVLFGAGNMFENYMSCYGGKFPPLFIVDNNCKLWGATKLGIMVKSPEEIMELSGDYGVIICNQFYYEIEQQLADMGIKHIHRFHDEYMPFK